MRTFCHSVVRTADPTRLFRSNPSSQIEELGVNPRRSLDRMQICPGSAHQIARLGCAQFTICRYRCNICDSTDGSTVNPALLAYRLKISAYRRSSGLIMCRR